MEPIQNPANDEYMHRFDAEAGFPRLLADVGGTSVRFVLEREDGRFDAFIKRSRREFASLSNAVQSYLAHPLAIACGAKHVRSAVVAIATPVDGDTISMTNADWSFSIEQERLRFGFDTLLVINDFKALAMAVPRLESHQVRQVGGGKARTEKPIGLLGPGTGLGVSGLISVDERWRVIESEGGHVSFSPVNEREAEILRLAWKEYPHVSAERLISGMGMELIYRVLTKMKGKTPDSLIAPDITRRASENACALCDETVETFCGMLGTVAGNLALTLAAQGGIYIGGGIVPLLGERFDRSEFRRRFEQKGRFSAYLSDIPTYVITAENPTLLGASVLLDAALK